MTDDLTLDVIAAQRDVIRCQRDVDAITDDTRWQWAADRRDRLDDAVRRLEGLEHTVTDWREP